MKLKLFIIIAILIIFPNHLVYSAVGIDPNKTQIIGQESVFNSKAGFSSTGSALDYAVILSAVIKAFLGLLGVIFVFLVITGGYNYFTAAGDEEKVEKAMKIIQRAVIGLIIIVAAYAITAFVFKNLPPGNSTSVGPGVSP